MAMKDYVKRGIQGRWKSATDDFGDQYDPTTVNGDIVYATQTNSQSYVTVINGSLGPQAGQWTTRQDDSSTLDSKIGNIIVGN